MMNFSKALLGLILLSCLSLGVQVAYANTTSSAQTEQVKVELISSVDAVYAGEEIILGVHQKIIPEWHTYWKNPGDSGIATTIVWTLPEGASAGELQWPIPSKHSLGPITNYGYMDKVTLFSKVKIPDSVKPGERFNVQAKVDWLVCHEDCIPQDAVLSIQLPVVKTGQHRRAQHPDIDAALAQLPVENPYSTELKVSPQELTLLLSGLDLHASSSREIWFFPEQWGKVNQSAEQKIQIKENRQIEIALAHGDSPLKPAEKLSGVLVVGEDTADGQVRRGYQLVLEPIFTQSEDTSGLGFLVALLLALLGGVILNLMPCVFPVLSIKAIALIKHSGDSVRVMRAHGFAYTAGILLSFLLLGLLLIVFKAGGEQIGWGFQFQSPTFVLAVAYLMFVVGLNLSGVFTIGASITGVGSSLADKSGYSGSFFTGVLATIVATPCTAPFMAAALGYALAQPAPKLLAVFLSLGLGLAAPYLLISTWPRLQKRLPKPGVWMDRAKQFLAFPMYAAAVWLIWVLAQQTDANAIAVALGGMVLLAMAVWVYELSRFSRPALQYVYRLATLLILLVVFFASYLGVAQRDVQSAPSLATSKSLQTWEAYSPQRLDQLLVAGKPVFLNFTAAWCISCLVNERVALSDERVAAAFKAAGITYLKGDWTNRDPQITHILNKFGRSGVPLYVFYPSGAGSAPKELPQILTPDVVIQAIQGS